MLTLIYYLIINLNNTVLVFKDFIYHYGYLSIIILMTLESASLPIPSEVILPFTGLLVSKGILDFYIALIAALFGNLIGIFIDYYIGYYLGKDFIYKNLQVFHIKKESLDDFDIWFSKNGNIAMFFSRMIPVVRGLVSFPAGFAQISKKRFLFYSMTGSLIYDTLLILFGMYALPTGNLVLLMASIGILAMVLFLIYKLFYDYMKRSNQRIKNLNKDKKIN